MRREKNAAQYSMKMRIKMIGMLGNGKEGLQRGEWKRKETNERKNYNSTKTEQMQWIWLFHRSIYYLSAKLLRYFVRCVLNQNEIFRALSALTLFIQIIINEEMHLPNSIDEPLEHLTQFPHTLESRSLPIELITFCPENAALSFLRNLK